MRGIERKKNMWNLRIKKGYDALDFKFEHLKDACDFVATAANKSTDELEFEIRKEGEEDVATD